MNIKARLAALKKPATIKKAAAVKPVAAKQRVVVQTKVVQPKTKKEEPRASAEVDVHAIVQATNEAAFIALESAPRKTRTVGGVVPAKDEPIDAQVAEQTHVLDNVDPTPRVMRSFEEPPIAPTFENAVMLAHKYGIVYCELFMKKMQLKYIDAVHMIDALEQAGVCAHGAEGLLHHGYSYRRVFNIKPEVEP